MMEVLTHRLLNDYQRDFPFEPRPYDHIARELDICTATLLNHLRDLQDRGGTPRRRGVPSQHRRRQHPGGDGCTARALERVAALSAIPEVNHNYEREHRSTCGSWSPRRRGGRHGHTRRHPAAERHCWQSIAVGPGLSHRPGLRSAMPVGDMTVDRTPRRP